MTHEIRDGDEVDGPENDASLPEAASIPTYDDPAMSDAPPLPWDLDNEDHG